MELKFKYLEVARGIFAPIIPIEILAGDKWLGFEGYIDTGATYSIFHVDVATLLNLHYEKGKQVMMKVGDGGFIPVYLHKLPVRIVNVEFKAIIGFSKSLGVDFNLIGRASFFEYFRICFSDREKVIILYPTKKK